MVLRLIFDMPVITSFICIGSFLLSYATYTQYISPTNLYLNYKLAFIDQFQPWRLLTSVLYIGELNLAIIFRLGFLQHMSSFLEQHTFKGSRQYIQIYQGVSDNVHWRFDLASYSDQDICRYYKYFTASCLASMVLPVPIDLNSEN